MKTLVLLLFSIALVSSSIVLKNKKYKFTQEKVITICKSMSSGIVKELQRKHKTEKKVYDDLYKNSYSRCKFLLDMRVH